MICASGEFQPSFGRAFTIGTPGRGGIGVRWHKPKLRFANRLQGPHPRVRFTRDTTLVLLSAATVYLNNPVRATARNSVSGGSHGNWLELAPLVRGWG